VADPYVWLSVMLIYCEVLYVLIQYIVSGLKNVAKLCDVSKN